MYPINNYREIANAARRVAVAGSGQGQYGEGMGDVMGILITDDPNLAYGFYNNCSQYKLKF